MGRPASPPSWGGLFLSALRFSSASKLAPIFLACVRSSFRSVALAWRSVVVVLVISLVLSLSSSSVFWAMSIRFLAHVTDYAVALVASLAVFLMAFLVSLGLTAWVTVASMGLMAS